MKTPSIIMGSMLIIYSAIVILFASDLYFMNQGDFDRFAWYFFEKPIDQNQRIWKPKEEFENLRPNLSLLIFWIFASLQSIWSDHYSLGATAMAARIIMLFYAWLLAKTLTQNTTSKAQVGFLLFFALSVCFFYSHNTAMLNSLYGEFIFMLSLPPLVLAVLAYENAPNKKSNLYLVALTSILIGTSKSQYFYAPMLLAFSMLAIDLRSRKPIKCNIYAALLIAQIICLLPVKDNKFAQLNYYHSMYFGSYMSLTNDQASQLGLTTQEFSCIGVDAWGNKASGPGGLKIESNQLTCYGQKKASVADVLRPYVTFPDLALKVFVNALPHLATVEYFHVYPDNAYISSSNRGFQPLRKLTSLRDAFITPITPIIIAAGLIISFFNKRAPSFLNCSILFLSLFFPSQLLISILGEGLRDLGKHMWAAQYSLDLLLVLIIFNISLMASKSKKSPALQ